MNIMPYASCSGFDGFILFDAAKALLSGICDCCGNLIVLMSANIDPKTEGTNISTAISAAATTIATLLVVIELCTQAMGFHFDDINDAVRFVFKVVVYKIIIENSSKIVNMVYGMFIDSKAWSQISGDIKGMDSVFDASMTDLDVHFNALSAINWILGFGQFFLALILLIIVILICGILIKIMAQIAGLLFELSINIAIAPIPIATLVNSQTRQIGIGFIKNFAGNCMTLMMYSLCFAIYGKISGNIQSAFASLLPDSVGDFKLYGSLVGVIVGVVLLSVAINNVSSMINKILS